MTTGFQLWHARINVSMCNFLIKSTLLIQIYMYMYLFHCQVFKLQSTNKKLLHIKQTIKYKCSHQLPQDCCWLHFVSQFGTSFTKCRTMKFVNKIIVMNDITEYQYIHLFSVAYTFYSFFAFISLMRNKFLITDNCTYSRSIVISISWF